MKLLWPQECFGPIHASPVFSVVSPLFIGTQTSSAILIVAIVLSPSSFISSIWYAMCIMHNRICSHTLHKFSWIYTRPANRRVKHCRWDMYMCITCICVFCILIFRVLIHCTYIYCIISAQDQQIEESKAVVETLSAEVRSLKSVCVCMRERMCVCAWVCLRACVFCVCFKKALWGGCD